MPIESVLDGLALGVYAACGPLAWTWALATIPMERKRMGRDGLSKKGPEASATPAVVIIIPAKDEAAGIRDCVAAVLGQDYPSFSVIAVDHRSTDGTGEILDQVAAADARLTVEHVKDATPAGWRGKNFAVDRGYARVGAEPTYILFVDADCVLTPGTLSAVMRGAVSGGAEVISLMPSLETGNFWERVIAPFAGLISSMLDRGLKEPYAYGWFMLFKRKAYDAVGGHAGVREALDDDKTLAMRVKKNGGRTRVWWGGDLISLRLDRPLSGILRGLARNFYTMSGQKPWRLLFCLFFVLACCISVVPALGIALARYAAGRHTNSYGWIACASVHLLAMMWAVSSIYAYGGVRRRMVWALPLTLAMMCVIFSRALWMCAGGEVMWRGIRYRGAEVASEGT